MFGPLWFLWEGATAEDVPNDRAFADIATITGTEPLYRHDAQDYRLAELSGPTLPPLLVSERDEGPIIATGADASLEPIAATDSRFHQIDCQPPAQGASHEGIAGVST